MLMNCWACTPELERHDAAATAAAINFAFMRILLPLFFRRETGRARAAGQPIQTTHARGKYAFLRSACRMAEPFWRAPPSTRQKQPRRRLVHARPNTVR